MLFKILSVALLGALPMSARAADLRLEDLQGLSIAATTVHSGTFRLGEKQGPGEITFRWAVSVNAQGVVSTSLRREVKSPRGTAHLNRSFKGPVGQPGQVGDGHFVWVLKGDALTLLRVMEVGGQTATYKLTKNGANWTCSLQTSMAKEVGAGDSRTQAAHGGKVTILGMKLVSSSCQASKKA
jgi:hypothetical protein